MADIEVVCGDVMHGSQSKRPSLVDAKKYRCLCGMGYAKLCVSPNISRKSVSITKNVTFIRYKIQVEDFPSSSSQIIPTGLAISLNYLCPGRLIHNILIYEILRITTRFVQDFTRLSPLLKKLQACKRIMKEISKM